MLANKDSRLAAECIRPTNMRGGQATSQTDRLFARQRLAERLESGESIIVGTADLRALFELAENALGYAEANFLDKWGAEAKLAAVRKILEGNTT